MNKKVDCIMRLLVKNECYMDICTWLIEQKFTELSEVQTKIRLQERAEFIYFLLKEAEEKEKLLLLDFEWVILPLETIRITCVTEREKKEFTYGL